MLKQYIDLATKAIAAYTSFAIGQNIDSDDIAALYYKHICESATLSKLNAELTPAERKQAKLIVYTLIRAHAYTLTVYSRSA